MSKVRAAIYARISSDVEGDRLGVQRQIDDCRAEAVRRGWQVADTYVDNDVSATRSRVRPEYVRLIGDITAGRVTGLVVWDVDRLTRTPRELEDIIDLADKRGLALASVGGDIDLATPQGRMTARIKGTVARHESEQMSRRIKRKLDERAEAGTPHGAPAYGYRRVDGSEVVDEAQASVIREAAGRLLAGESLRGIAGDLNRRGLAPPRQAKTQDGKPARTVRWSSTTLRQVLMRDRNAGLRVHRGRVIGPGTWPPIYDEGTHDRVVATIRNPARKTTKGSTRRHLLTGIARCGREGCDGTMVVNVGRLVDGARRQPPAYVCSTCHRIRRKQSDVDDVVSRAMISMLSQSDIVAAIAAGDPQEAARGRDRVAEIEAKLDRAADDYAMDVITANQLARINARLRPQLEDAQAAVAGSEPAPMLAGMAGVDSADRWAAAPLEVKRALIEMLIVVTILPSGPGRAFDASLVRISDSRANAQA